MFEHKDSNIQREVRARLACGGELVALKELISRIGAIGYSLDRSLDCKCTARTITGPDAGTTYPCTTAYPVERDTGKSFASIHARRDENFDALQAMRLGGVFAVVRGRIFDL